MQHRILKNSLATSTTTAEDFFNNSNIFTTFTSDMVFRIP